jgi:hypothetical protein
MARQYPPAPNAPDSSSSPSKSQSVIAYLNDVGIDPNPKNSAFSVAMESQSQENLSVEELIASHVLEINSRLKTLLILKEKPLSLHQRRAIAHFLVRIRWNNYQVMCKIFLSYFLLNESASDLATVNTSLSDIEEEHRFGIVWDTVVLTLANGHYDAHNRVGERRINLFGVVSLLFLILFFLFCSHPKDCQPVSDSVGMCHRRGRDYL